MKITILGGVAKGTALSVPKGDLIRPTSVRLKRRLFDSRQDWSDYCFVDLSAGTGAMGLEAWSRFAAAVYLIEPNPKVFNVLNENVKRLTSRHENASVERPVMTIRKNANAWLDYHGLEILKKYSHVVFFFDPPYAKHELYRQVVERVAQWSDEYSSLELWVESDKQKGLLLSEWPKLGMTVHKLFEQGSLYFAHLVFPREERHKD